MHDQQLDKLLYGEGATWHNAVPTTVNWHDLTPDQIMLDINNLLQQLDRYPPNCRCIYKPIYLFDPPSYNSIRYRYLLGKLRKRTNRPSRFTAY